LKKSQQILPQVELGGEYAISYPIGIALIPFMTFGVVVSEWLKNTKISVGDWSVAAIYGTAFTAVVLMALDHTILKNRITHPIPNNALFGIGFFLGAIKGFVTGITASRVLHIPGVTFTDDLLRALTSAILGMFIVPTIAFCSYSWHRLIRYRKFAQERLSAIEEVTENLINEKSRMVFLENTQKRLTEIKLDFKNLAKNQKEFDGIVLADNLEKMARDVIRPLSHKVAKNRKSETSFFAIFTDSLKLFPVVLRTSNPWVLVLYTLFSSTFLINGRGVEAGLKIVALRICVLAIVLYGLSAILSRLQVSLTFIILICTLALSLAPYLHYEIYLWITGEKAVEAFWINFTTILFLFLISNFASIFSAFEIKRNNDFDAKYMKEFDQVLRKNNSNVEISNELVRYLHGTLQTRLSASAFRFRNSASNPEEFDFEEELRTVFSHFDLEDSMSHALVQEDLLSKLNEIVTKWDGLIQSTSDVNIDLSRLNSEKVSKICDFVNEALSNALRHGKADSATIEVRDAINDVLVEVSNNGQPVMGKSNGLGSALFDELTNRRWQIGKNPKGPGVRVSGLISRFS